MNLDSYIVTRIGATEAPPCKVLNFLVGDESTEADNSIPQVVKLLCGSSFRSNSISLYRSEFHDVGGNGIKIENTDTDTLMINTYAAGEGAIEISSEEPIESRKLEPGDEPALVYAGEGERITVYQVVVDNAA